MPLKKTGVQFVTKDLDSFLHGMARANAAVAAFGHTATQASNAAGHGIGSANGSLDSLGRSAMSASTKVGAAGQIMIGMFREVGAVATRAIFDVGRAAGRLAADFGKVALGGAMDLQDSMNLLGATSGATGEQLAQLKKQAVALGADLTLPATSAADAGAAMLELSKAGLSVDNVMKAAKGTLQLAAAANISEAQAAEIASNALNAFHLEGDRAVFVADLLAGAANKSSIEITDAAASFQMAAAVFSQFQGPAVGAEQAMVDMTTAIAILGNAGIKGSDAGTSLKQMLLMLVGPTDKAKDLMKQLARSIGVSGSIAFTAAGKMRPLEEIIGLVTKATAKMTEEQRGQVLKDIFGADSIRAVLELMRAGPAAFDQMSTAITKQGSAARLAAARTAGLRGAWDGLKSQIETAGIVLAEPFLDPLEGGLKRVADLIGTLPIDQWAKDAAQGLGGLMQVFGGSEEAPNPAQRRMGGAVSDAFMPGGDEQTGGIGGANMGEQALAQLLDARNKIVEFILDSAPDVIDAMGSWGVGMGNWITENAPGMIQTFGEKTAELITSIGTHTPGILEKLGEWGGALGQWVVDATPGMLRELGSAAGQIADAIGPALSGVAAPAPPPAKRRVGGEVTEEFLPGGEEQSGIVEGIAEWGKALIEWVPEAAPKLFKELLDLSSEVLDWVVERVPGITEQLGKWALAFAEWVPGAAIDLIIAAGEMFGDLLKWIVDKGPDLLVELGLWASQFNTWIVVSAIPALFKGLGDLWTKLTGWIGEKATDIAKDGSIGRAIVDGIWKGITDTWNGLVKHVNMLMSLLPGSMGDAIEAHSPSLLTARTVGKPMAQGIGVGFEHEIMRMQRLMTNSMAKLATPQSIMPAQRGDMFIPQQAQQIAQGGGGASVSIQINNPVVDSNERVSQLGAQIRRSVFASLHNGVAGLKLEGVS